MEARYPLFFMVVAMLTACTTRDTFKPVQADSTLGTFCDRLPRPEFAALDKHAASDEWFEVYEVRPGTFAIYEPWQWQEVISWLIVGDTRALLFDTGNGIADIRRVVGRLTNRPLTVLNSHSHADHVGGNHAFVEILSTMDDFAIARSRGLPFDAVADEVSPQALCRGLPDGYQASEHRLRPYPLSDRVFDGARIDLGGRVLEVIAIPGHTPDSVALLEREPGYLWTGDTFYMGPIWLYAPETDFDAYRESMARLAALAPKLTALFPAHNTPEADPAVLGQALAGFDAMRAGDIEAELAWPGTVTYPVGDFSFLVREGAFDAR
ncbi:MAG: MBL fold metallo-hydrolase [Pseudomonadota bacterium]